MTTSSEIRAAALRAYAGWNGWYHQFHWPEDSVEMVRKIQGEAVQAAADMRKKIDELRARIRQCEIVAGMAGDYLLDAGEETAVPASGDGNEAARQMVYGAFFQNVISVLGVRDGGAALGKINGLLRQREQQHELCRILNVADLHDALNAVRRDRDPAATIDEIRELAQQWAEATPEPERKVVADLLFAFHCEASAVKCRRSNDLVRARWYEAMAGHAVEPPCGMCSGAGEEGGCPACGMVPW